MRNLMLFAAVFFCALVAGGAFVIWIEYDPSGMTAGLYTATMQHAIRVFTAPLPAIVVLSIVFTVASAFLGRGERPAFYLFLAASICAIAVALITAFGNVPINNQIKMWDISSPPENWADLGTRWWRFQTLRAGAAILGLSCVIVAAIRPRHEK